MNDVLLDTNIFIYAYDRSSPFHGRCAGLFSNSSIRFYTTSKNITECVAVMTKLNFPKSDIEQLLSDISTNINVLYPTLTSLSVFTTLFKKYAPRGNRVYDLEVASIMIDNGIQDIATINSADFVYITEVNVFQF